MRGRKIIKTPEDKIRQTKLQDIGVLQKIREKIEKESWKAFIKC